MSKRKIEERFHALEKKGDRLFIPYIMAGDGGLSILNNRISFLEESGAAAVELGIPFSDPVADGDTIQQAGIRALNEGVTLKQVLQTIAPNKEDRKIPVILMTYINPIFRYGVEQFAADCASSGVDGIIIPDIPMEEEALVAGALQENDIAFIRLAAMTSPKERLKQIAAQSEGFLYAVSVTGTTGARATHQEHVYDYLADLKKHAQVPVLAGFGVSTPEQAHRLAKHCDGVIVGSKIVSLFHEGRDEEVRKLIEASTKPVASRGS